MNILIKQSIEVKDQLEETQTLLENKKMTEPIINRIKIINDKLLDISKTLTELNINIKNNNQIKLTKEEEDYLECDKNSNLLLTKIMPALTILSLHN